MEGTINTHRTPESHRPTASLDGEQPYCFSQEWIAITKQEHIDLNSRANYWEAQHSRVKAHLEEARQEMIRKDAKIKDLQNRIFGKKSEKASPKKAEKDNTNTSSRRRRGQQPGSQGHGRTQRPSLPVIHEENDLRGAEKICLTCGLSYQRNPALDEHSDMIEVEVSAHIRRIKRPAYTRHPGCCCENTAAIITASPPPRLIPRSDYSVSFWVEIICNFSISPGNPRLISARKDWTQEGDYGSMLSHGLGRYAKASSNFGFHRRPGHADGIDAVGVLSFSTRADPGIAR